MGQAPLPKDEVVDLVREGRLYADDGNGWVKVQVDANGNLQTDATLTDSILGVENASGTQINPATEGTLSALAAALASNGTDTLQTEQQSPVSVENTSGTQVSPATEGTLSSTLSREIATWSAGTLPVEPQTPVAIEDSTGTQVDPATSGDVSALQDAAAAYENGTAVASGGSTSKSLSALGASTVRGRVSRATTSYDVTIEWQDDAGNTIFSDSIASGVTAGTETAINEPAISDNVTITVADAGSGSGAVDATYHMR